MGDTKFKQIAAAITRCIQPGATIVASTGAGCSKESGVPTFRGEGGLWEEHRPEEVASSGVLANEPDKFWQFHDEIRRVIAQAAPNPAHETLAEMEQTLDDVEFAVITQNIDNLHQDAGSETVIELHGNAFRYYCVDCGKQIADVPQPAEEYPPLCPDCDGVVRPDVVLFGEMLPQDALRDAGYLTTTADVFLSIGTSVIVQPAASLPFTALRAGATVVEVNPSPTELTPAADYSVQEPAGGALPNIWEEIRSAAGEQT